MLGILGLVLRAAHRKLCPIHRFLLIDFFDVLPALKDEVLRRVQ